MKSVQKGFTLIELMIVVAIIAILAAIAIPQYQAYVIRSQVARVMGEAGDMKVVVEDCINNGATIAQVTATANTGDPSCVLTASSSDLMGTASGTGVPGIPDVELKGNNSPSATITATFGDHANTVLSTSTLTWSRNISGGWSCQTTVASNYAPSSCPTVAAGS